MPAGYPLSTSLNENNAQKASTASAAYKLKRMIDGSQWDGKNWYAYGASLTEFGMYTAPLAAMSGMTCNNKGKGGEGITTENHIVKNRLLDNTDGKTNADLITIEVLGNDPLSTFGTIYDGGVDSNGNIIEGTTFIGTLVQCILSLQRNTNAQIVIIPFTDLRYQYGNPSNLLLPNRNFQSAGGKCLAELRQMIQTVCNMWGVFYVDPNEALGWAKKTNDYISDQVHYTALGGYVVAEYLWSKIKNIPLWRTAIPT